MPYRTERGVTTYHDRDTPSEYATGRDEDAARFNDARDRAAAASEDVATLLDALYEEPIPDKAAEMAAIEDAVAALVVRIRNLSK